MDKESLGAYLDWYKLYGHTIDKDFWTTSAIDGFYTTLSCEVHRYLGHEVKIPLMRKVLREDDALVSLHLDSYGSAKNLSMGETMVAFHHAVKVLPEMCSKIQEWKGQWDVRFVVCASHEKLIDTMRMIFPLFQYVDELPSEGITKHDIVRNVRWYDRLSAEHTESGHFPVIIAPVNLFLKRAEKIMRLTG